MVSIKLASSKRSLSTASLLDSSMVIFHSQHLANPISNLSSLSNHNSNSLFMLECHSSSQTCRYADLFVLGEWDVRERIFLLPMLGHFFHQCAFFCQQAQSGKFTGYVPQQMSMTITCLPSVSHCSWEKENAALTANIYTDEIVAQFKNKQNHTWFKC